MNVLINANCTKGGSIPWCAAMISDLGKYAENRFTVCVSPQVRCSLGNDSVPAENVEILDHPRRSRSEMFFRRSPALDALVASRGIDMVLTVFGPSYWRPRVRHICGFAKSQYIYDDSPFFRIMGLRERIKLAVKRHVHMKSFLNDVDVFVTETETISARLRQLIPGKKVYTISNSCNPVFEHRESWMKRPLPVFDGVTLLTVSANYPHKNLGIIRRVAAYLLRWHPEFKFRFAVTLNAEALGFAADKVPAWLLPLGSVDIRECPSLYEQSDFMFLPTLLECFSASYVEAMKIGRPILTSDLPFARGTCGDAADYFDPLSPEDIGEAIYRLAHDPARQRQLADNGREQIKNFLTSDERTESLMRVLKAESERIGK